LAEGFSFFDISSFSAIGCGNLSDVVIKSRECEKGLPFAFFPNFLSLFSEGIGLVSNAFPGFWGGRNRRKETLEAEAHNQDFGQRKEKSY